jgi:hypothetical protein
MWPNRIVGDLDSDVGKKGEGKVMRFGAYTCPVTIVLIATLTFRSDH